MLGLISIEVETMNRPSLTQGLAGAGMVAGIYGYFLLFSQFAFLEIVTHELEVESRIKLVLSLMALGGIVGSILVARRKSSAWLPYGLIACLIASAGSGLATGMVALMLLSCLMGLGLGVATVSLAASLPQWFSSQNGCWWVGCGTGAGYALCNVPSIFQATPPTQAWISCGFVLLALLSRHLLGPALHETSTQTSVPMRSATAVVVMFFALVWMDSGAFYIIQHAEELKKATWGADRLWWNAGLHFAAAVIAGATLASGRFRLLLLSAALILGTAAWWVNDPNTRSFAAIFYPIGVSFYSTALVCWPGLLSPRESSWKRASWVFALAGWVGSGLGIGMAENLHRVPSWFILSTLTLVIALLFGSTLRKHAGRWSLAVLALFLVAHEQTQAPPELSAVERGKQVYLAEGCIHCHSQYLRPNSIDTTLWGKASSTKKVLENQPVLIGNRRQGPDLTHVGARRSAAWLKEHFEDPRALVPDSVMPSYRHLFTDGRGDDLIAYLQRDLDQSFPVVQKLAQDWQPDSWKRGDLSEGKKLFHEHCAVCHGNDGQGKGALAAKWHKAPSNLAQGPWIWSSPREGESHAVSIARVIRFGIPGTDMPGHETWTDEQTQAVTEYLLQWRQPTKESRLAE